MKAKNVAQKLVNTPKEDKLIIKTQEKLFYMSITKLANKLDILGG